MFSLIRRADRVRKAIVWLVVLTAVVAGVGLAHAGPEILAVFAFPCNTDGRCLEAINGGSGVGVYGQTAAGGNGAVRGVTPPGNTNGIGVYGKSADYIGVYGQGGSSIGDAGGSFSGYYGVTGHGTDGAGVYGSTSTGTSGGVHGFTGAGNEMGVGVQGTSYAGIGVRGRGGYGFGDAGGHFSGYNGVAGYGEDGFGVYGSTSTGTSGAVSGFTGVANNDGVGVYGTAYAGIGVRGQGGTHNGGDYGGYFTGYTGVRAQGSEGPGVYAYSQDDDALYGLSYGTQNSDYGAQVGSPGRGLYANGGPGNWDGYFLNCARIGGTTYGNCGTAAPLSAGMSMIALNNGPDALAPGDVVVFQGMGTVEGVPDAVMLVAKASGVAGEVVVGVMKDAYVLSGEEKAAPAALSTPAGADGAMPDEGSPPAGFNVESPAEAEAAAIMGAGDSGSTVAGEAAPGGLLFVQIEGIALVNVDTALGGPILGGSSLMVGGNGRAGAWPAGFGDGAMAGGAQVLGRALESLESGDGAIYVLLGAR